MAVRTTPRSAYRWNAAANRYIASNGQFVAALTVRHEVDAALESATLRARALAESLKTGEITVEEWELGMRGLVKDVHLYNASAARGGWAQLTQDDYGRVGRIVRDQYAYLRGFRQDIEQGLPLDGRFLARTRLYAQAGRATYHVTERRGQLERGNTVERNILGVADHCQDAADGSTEGCPEQTDRGWVPIGTLVPIGRRTCIANCKCAIGYSTVAAIADAASGPTGTSHATDEVPASLSADTNSPYRAKYAMAVMDMDTCPHCAAFDGVVVEVSDPRRLPDHACTSERGCQCTWIFIRKEESQ